MVSTTYDVVVVNRMGRVVAKDVLDLLEPEHVTRILADLQAGCTVKILPNLKFRSDP